MTTARDAAARLGELLDYRADGWWSRIDVNRLDQALPADCAAGQLCTDTILRRFTPGVDTFLRTAAPGAIACARYRAYTTWLSNIPETAPQERAAWLRRHGFLADDQGWARLTTEVKQQILARKRGQL